MALDFLARFDQTLPVIPNYSYVCLGTAFFVPIHGSAADFSSVAETITRVVLFDPVHDRLIMAKRDDPAFQEHVYNPGSALVLLTLDLRIKPKSRYYVRRQELESPLSADIVGALRDEQATNVEIRKPSAAGTKLQVSRYYNEPQHGAPPGDFPSSPLSQGGTGGGGNSASVELPRDSLGRLWDRLEENPVTSWLFHALTRYLAWHVELFFTSQEFETFWESHQALPLRKIQVRLLRRDGFPHSPFRDQDCVSVDLFMLRRHRQTFEKYLKRTFAVIRYNPGKHSM
jgi:hypothetical protein